MKIMVTGAAGFIGSNLVDRLLVDGYEVTGYDNLSTGQIRFLDKALLHDSFNFLEADLLDKDKLNDSLKGIDFVFHLAANADVRFGLDHPYRDLEQNTIATFNLLEAMKLNNCKKIAFSSTGSIYGESSVIPTPEDAPFPIQTSLYGASKLACEGMISAYSEGYNFQSWIFRFVSILGERYTHGHVFDFYNKLSQNPNILDVLGDGEQRKSYLYINDCIDAMMLCIKKSEEKINIFNLGHDEYCQVNNSIGWICKNLELQPELKYSGGKRGWVGDNPFIHLDNSKVKSLGWKPSLTIEEGIIKTVTFLKENEWVFEERE
tara:strand:+ start:614 stop:1570 length:957 start_codon:yes stop_codon:yes gene_type:complete